MGMRHLSVRAGALGRLFQYLWKERVWWLIPMVVVLLLFVGLIVFGQSSAAPFIYTLF